MNWPPGKPVGFKLCVGSRVDVLAVCKAMLAEGVTPDFIIVDGAEGGTAAAPLEYEDNIGLPLTDGLMTVHNALVGTGLRDRIRIGASGKVASGNDIIKRLIQGADYTNSARSMMMAAGCIQSQRCHTNHCPVGVATQDPYRARALDVADKSERVYRYQQATVAQAMRMMGSMGVSDPSMLNPHMLRKRVSPTEQRSYAELYEWLAPGELLDHAPATWRSDWEVANPDSFAPVGRGLNAAGRFSVGASGTDARHELPDKTLVRKTCRRSRRRDVVPVDTSARARSARCRAACRTCRRCRRPRR